MQDRPFAEFSKPTQPNMAGRDVKSCREIEAYLFSGKAAVKLIFPCDFRGLVKIDLLPLDEKDWVPGQRHFPVHVPQSGLAEVKGPTPLWRNTYSMNFSGQFADGTLLPRDRADYDPTIAMRWLTCMGIGGGVGESYFFAVGTNKDFEFAKNIVYRRIGPNTVTFDHDSVAVWVKRQQEQ